MPVVTTSLGYAFIIAMALILIVTNLGVAQINVQVSDATTRSFRLNSDSKSAGLNLKRILQTELKAQSSCVVWADQPTEALVTEIVVKANHCKISFLNVTLKAPVDQDYDYILSVAGNGIRLSGAQFDGNGPAIDQTRKNNGRGEGIRIVGKNCHLTNCYVSNMPNGRSANCYYIAGDNAFLFRCRALNPGYACFRCVTNNATFDRLEATINHATRNGHNRLFNVDSNLAKKRGTITIRNSSFSGDFIDKDLPLKLREVVLNFDPGDPDEKGLDNLVIENCIIRLAESVRSIRNHHVFKIKNVTNSRLDNLAIITPLNYQGCAMRLQKTQADISMNCQVVNCRWDQGINFDSELETILISNCQLGKQTAYGNELLNDVNFPIKMLIERSLLIHQKSLASLRSKNEKCSLKFRDVSFISEAKSPNTFVFRSEVPTRPSFFNAVNFKYAKSVSSLQHHRLWLAYSPSTRLAMSSYRGLDNTLLFDPKLGVAKQTKDGRTVNSTGVSKVTGPPFTGISGQPGDKIFLASGQDRNAHGWENASFWSWNSEVKHWVPITTR